MDIIEDLTAVHFTVPTWKKRNLVLIIHSMDGTYQGTISWFRNKDSGGSTQFLISKAGEIRHMVKDEYSAWGAMGMTDEFPPKAYWNDISIHIELEDEGKREKWVYPEAQKKALIELCNYLSKKYSIPLDAKHVRLHKLLDPTRRSDPVGNFDINWIIKQAAQPVTGGSMDNVVFKDAMLDIIKTQFNDNYDEKWNDDQKKEWVKQKKQRIIDAIKAGQTPQNPVVDPLLQAKYDKLLQEDNILKQKVSNYKVAHASLLE